MTLKYLINMFFKMIILEKYIKLMAQIKHKYNSFFAIDERLALKKLDSAY